MQTILDMNGGSLWSTLIQTRLLLLWLLLKLEILSAEPKRRFVRLKPPALLLCLEESSIEYIRHALNGTLSFVPDMPYLFFCALLLMP